MKKLIGILSVVLFANHASAWEVFGLNENTKLEDLEVLEKEYSVTTEVFQYQILPPKPNPLGNEYNIQYSQKHGICYVSMWALWDKPYPYGKTLLSVDYFGVVLYNNWKKLLSILKRKYGEEDQLAVGANSKSSVYYWYDRNDKIKQYGFSSISINVPNNQYGSVAYMTYTIDNPDCRSAAQEDAAEQNAESMGVSSDDF